MKTAWREVVKVAAFLAVATAACSSPTSSSTASPGLVFHAEVGDPVGDAVSSSGVPNPPDLVHGTVDVALRSVTFTIQFAPGTMDPQTTRLAIDLDTDQNASTGIPAGTGLGIDYVLDLWAARTAQQTLVQLAMPSSCASGGTCYAIVGSTAVAVGTATLSATVPLTMLGNASGRMNYRVFAYGSPQPVMPTVVADVMPDINLPPAHLP